MSPAHEHQPTGVPGIDERARRTARRLLAGAGSATVSAYRLDPSGAGAYVAHALDVDGLILIAIRPQPGTPLADAPDDRLVDVRLDIVLDASEPGIRVTAASAHVLGTLRWVPANWVETVLAECATPVCHCAITGEDPLGRVSELARTPGARLALVQGSRVILHGPDGVSRHMVEDLAGHGDEEAAMLQAAWSPLEVLDAHEAVRSLGDLSLRALCEAVIADEAPGSLCSRRPSIGVARSLIERVLVVDVDPWGATLMHVGAEETRTVLVALPGAPLAPAEIAPALGALADELLPARFQPR